MLKNYITTAINNLLKNKLYSAINIIGLAVGFSACLLITLYVQNELSYDKHWEKADLIYKICNGDGSQDKTDPSTSLLLLPALKKYFHSEIALGTRLMPSVSVMEVGDKRYQTEIAQVDRDFIDMFDAEELKGSLSATLHSPGNIALSDESAFRYFGNNDPIDETVTFKGKQYKVTAIYRFRSQKTVLNIPGFTLLEEPQSGSFMQSWLERFPYRFNSLIMIPICLVSGLIALIIAWFTVAGNTRRVARNKPIKALRYE